MKFMNSEMSRDVTVVICDGTVDGIFTAIYKAWHIGTSRTRIGIGMQDMELFTTYEEVATDYEISAKVAHTIVEKISKEAYDYIYMAACAPDPERGEAIYRFMIRGMHLGFRVVEDFSNPYVEKVLKLRKRVWYESHHFMGFIRFSELEGVLVARFEPENNILPIVADYFEDRLSIEDFIILDSRRGIAALHKKRDHFVIAPVNDKIEEFTVQNSDDYSKLWKVFFNTIAIKERENYELQRNNIPLRYRTFMDEFM